MINNQKLSYKLFLKDVPISNNLKKILALKKISKINCISNGDDYQVLFTASPDKSRIILNTAKYLGIKITRIGKIISGNRKSIIIGQKGQQILLKSKGYSHQF